MNSWPSYREYLESKESNSDYDRMVMGKWVNPEEEEMSKKNPEPKDEDQKKEEYEVVDTYKGQDTTIYYDTDDNQHVVVNERD